LALKNLAILVFPGARAREYLAALAENNLLPEFAILLRAKTGGNAEEMALLEKNGISFVDAASHDINAPETVACVTGAKQDFFIFCGGGILRGEMLSTGKNFLHVHPGRLPDFRGSTCFYYSIIAENDVTATAFFLASGIDTGNIVCKKSFGLPDSADIDNFFDNNARAKALVQAVKGFAEKGFFAETPQDGTAGETFFVIHPLLKHLAIMSVEKALAKKPAAKQMIKRI